DHLPPNFRDAVRTTRRLGFRYVWIDSLCIIQGPDGDWAEQAPLMDRVYMNAELCLAAAASEDAYGGFFRSRDPADLQPFRVDLQLPGDASPSSSSSHPQLRPFYAYCGGQDPTILWAASVERAPLNRRGWVQQERVLAPRTVHFGQTQVFWECRQLQACEAGPDSALAGFQEAMVKNWETKGPDAIGERARERTKLSSSPLPPISATDVYLAWRGIIGSYSRCALSIDKDKLVAASGLAKAFSRHLGQEYVAGLWRGPYLVKELLWTRAKWNVGSRTTARRHKEYQAPTWSWASIDGPVEWGLQNRFEDCAEVVGVVVDTVTSDPTGAVRRAEITLSGSLVPQPQGSALVGDYKRFMDVEGEDLAVPGDGIYLAPLCVTFLGTTWKSTWGLILTDAGAGHKGKYRRLGLFCCVSHSAIKWYGTSDAVQFTIV
ncbi:HET-domain-containing protein, partial [Cryphonectria parasitica EP155]